MHPDYNFIVIPKASYKPCAWNLYCERWRGINKSRAKNRAKIGRLKTVDIAKEYCERLSKEKADRIAQGLEQPPPPPTYDYYNESQSDSSDDGKRKRGQTIVQIVNYVTINNKKKYNTKEKNVN